jgi:hypothetical protein
LCEERTRTIEPARALTAETLQLERNLSDLVNQAYGLTPTQIALMWKTVLPRHAHRAAVGHRVVHGEPKHSNPQLISQEMVEELRQLTLFDPEHLPEENILVFPMAALTWISMQGAGRTVANCTPAGQRAVHYAMPVRASLDFRSLASSALRFSLSYTRIARCRWWHSSCEVFGYEHLEVDSRR